MNEPKSHNKRYIMEPHIIEILRANGFECNKYKPTYENTAGGIHFYFQSEQDIKNMKWYETNCPVPFGGKYVLPDGTILKSIGTTLTIV